MGKILFRFMKGGVAEWIKASGLNPDEVLKPPHVQIVSPPPFKESWQNWQMHTVGSREG